MAGGVAVGSSVFVGIGVAGKELAEGWVVAAGVDAQEARMRINRKDRAVTGFIGRLVGGYVPACPVSACK